MTGRTAGEKRWRIGIALMLIPGLAFANPLGEAVRHGNVQFERTDTALRVLQGSNKAIIDWDSFSISPGELTEFIQPGSNAAALNRVRGAALSRIDGALRANGRVLLINPNGIVVGPTGTVDVAGFIASTLDIPDNQFLAGGDLNFRGNSPAAVINLGKISAYEGDIFLIANEVRNAGTLSAPNGTVGMAAGTDVLIREAGQNERIFVRAGNGQAVNTGNIEGAIAELKAYNGNLYGMAVKNEGRIAATGVTKNGGQIFLSANGGKIRNTGTLKAQTSDGSGGRISIDAGPGGSVEAGGTIDAKGPTGTGGEIVILGSEIEVLSDALVIADGQTGGGSIFIGGGRRGNNPNLLNADNVTVKPGARISANALGSGDGGTVILFAKDTLRFDGTVSARGGPNGGNGGFVELSGQKNLYVPDIAGRIDVGAPGGGTPGTLLIDPDTTIIDSEPSGPIGSPASGTLVDADVSTFLETASLVIESPAGGGNILVDGNVDIIWVPIAAPTTLTFNSANDFVMDPGATIDASFGSGAIDIFAARDVFLNTGSSLKTAGGDIDIEAARSTVVIGATVSTGAGSLNLDANQGSPQTGGFDGILLDGSNLNSVDGNITIDGLSGGASTGNRGIRLESATVQSTGAGSVTLNGAGGAGPAGQLNGVGLFANSLVSAADGNVTIAGTGGGDGSTGSVQQGGVVIFSGTVETSGAGDVIINGIGGNAGGTSVAEGAVIFDTVRTTGTGDITITGTPGPSNSFEGVLLTPGASIQSAGNLSIDSTHNVTLNSGASLMVTDGDLSIHANTAGSAAGEFNGINLFGSTITTAGTGNVELIGQGGDSAIPFAAGSGIVMSSGAIVESTLMAPTAGTITFTGTGGAGPNNRHGVALGGLTTGVYSEYGDIQITGQGGGDGTGSSNYGVLLENIPTTIASTGSGMDAATITIDGTGGSGVTDNDGVQFRGNVTVSTIDGAIAITGTGADVDGSFHGSRGVDLEDDAMIQSTGLGMISITGTGGAGTNGAGSTGVSIGGFGAEISSVDSAILITGTGGNVSGDGSSSAGIQMKGSAGISSTGTGNVTLIGNGGTAVNALTANGVRSAGVEFIGTNTMVSSHDGSIEITGTSADVTGESGNSEGVRIGDGVSIKSTGTGNVTLQGDAGMVAGGTPIAGGSSRGVAMLGPNSELVTDGGDIQVVGTSDGVSGQNSITQGIQISGKNLVQAAGSGNITLDGTGGVAVGGTASGNSWSVGVSLAGSEIAGSPEILSVDTENGNIEITGTGGQADGLSSSSQGTSIGGNVSITSTGTGNISIGGFGGVATGGDLTWPVQSEGTVIRAGGGQLTDITANGGTIQIAGTGADLNGEGTGTTGLRIGGGVSIMNSGAGAITLNGTGGMAMGGSAAGGSWSTGVALQGSDFDGSPEFVQVGTVDGSIVVSGLGGNTSGENASSSGLEIGSIVDISSSGTGNVILQGTGGGFSSAGPVAQGSSQGLSVWASGNTTTIEASGGDIQFVGTGGSISADDGSSQGLSIGGELTIENFGSGGISLAGIGGAVSGISPSSVSWSNGVFLTGDSPGLLNIRSVDGSIGIIGSGGASSAADGSSQGVDLGDAVSISTSGTGGVSVNGIGGTSTIDSFGTRLSGPLTTIGTSGQPIQITGSDANGDLAVIVEAGTVQSSGGNIGIGGGSILLEAPAMIDPGAGFLSVYGGPATDDQFTINAALPLPSTAFNGVGGSNNLLDFNGLGGPIALNADQLFMIQDVIGTPSNADLFRGPAAVATTFDITDVNQFSFTDAGTTTTVAEFENLNGGNFDDRFQFRQNSQITGSIDGNGGINTLDYFDFGTGVVVNLDNGTGTAIGGGFNNIQMVTGSPEEDTLTGPGGGGVFNLTGPNQFDVDGVFFIDEFENLIGGPGDDVFNLGPGARLSGFIDGGPASTFNTLNYRSFDAPVGFNFRPNTPTAGPARFNATGIQGGFVNVTRLIGSPSADDTLRGPATGTVYTIDGVNAFNFAAGDRIAVTDVENLGGGPGADQFNVIGGGLGGQLNGGDGFDVLSYAGFPGPVAVNAVTGNATGFGGIANIENLVGSPAVDTLATAAGRDTFNIVSDNAGNIDGRTQFSSFEVLRAGAGNDRFNFLNQASAGFADGGAGSGDLLFLNLSGPANASVTIREGRIDLNPTWQFGGIETIEILFGSGNDTANTRFTSFDQILRGGPGNDTLQLPGNPPLTGNRVTSGDRSITFFDFDNLAFGFPSEDPPPAIEEMIADMEEELMIGPELADTGDILQLEVDHQLNIVQFDPGGPGFGVQNQFTPGTLLLSQQSIAALQGAFSAAVAGIAQGVVINVNADGTGLIFTPFSLDGSGLSPSTFVVDALNAALSPLATSELADAIDFDAAIFLFNPDGAYAIDLSVAAIDPAVLDQLQANLAIVGALELFAALELDVVLVLFPNDGPVPIGTGDPPAAQAILILLDSQFTPEAQAELMSALEDSDGN